MNSKIIAVLITLGMNASLFAGGITKGTLPFGQQIETEGKIVVNLNDPFIENKVIGRSFYGADTHGFSQLPAPKQVIPLQLGFVKFGGNLYSTFNWQLDAYYDSHDNGIFYANSPLEDRLKLSKQGYGAEMMFQVNMLGWMPKKNENGLLIFSDSANAKHAGDAITYLNGTKKIGLEHIIMGNEPFNADVVHGKDIPSADEYIEKYIQYAISVRSAQEKISGNSNDIKLWGPELATGWTGWQTTHPKDCVEDYSLPEKMHCSYGNGKFKQFMPYFLFRLSQFENDSVRNPKKYKMLDFITWHYYPLFRKNFQDRDSIILNFDGNENIIGMLESVNLWDSEVYVNKYDYSSPRNVTVGLVNKFKRWRDSYYPNAKLAVTEIGIDSEENIDYHPIVRPLYLADLVPRLGTSGVDTFVHSFLQGGNDWSKWALVNGINETNLYSIYSLYSNFYKGKVLSVTDTFNDKVNAYSVKDENGVNVFLVNKDKISHSSSLAFSNGGNLNSITSFILEPWSLTVLSIPNNRLEKIIVRTFGAKEMGISLE